MRLLTPHRFLALILFLCLASHSQRAAAQDETLTPDTTAASTSDHCLAFKMPGKDVIFAARKKVFAHYFSRFPVSIDGKPANSDYYTTQYLSPAGEQNKWLDHGGYLRTRPLPPPFLSGGKSYVVDDLKDEVRLALSRGISGFTFDILALQDIAPGGYLMNMLEATAAVDSRFKIILMPDMASMGPSTDNVVTIVRTLYDQPGLYRLADGSLVVAPFLSEAVTPDAWESMTKQLASEGKKIAFFPTFLSTKPQYYTEYNGFSRGLGTFGTPYPGNQTFLTTTDAAAAHASHMLFMEGISPQGYRPKDFIYWEAEGSSAYRNGWEGAINGNADWIQLTTWNDLSETTQVAPYMDASGTLATGFFNLTGYYADWFITGKQPKITHDVLYYFYRKEPVAAAAPNTKQPTTPAKNTEQGIDIIDVIAFATAPGTLSISIGDQNSSQSIQAGMNDFHVPLQAGVPRFILTRNNKTIISVNGTPPIVGQSGLQNGYIDLTYWGGSASSTGTCEASDIWGNL